MIEILVFGLEPALIPARVTSGSEEVCAHVVVDTVNFPTVFREVVDNLRANESGRTGHQKILHRAAGSGGLYKVEESFPSELGSKSISVNSPSLVTDNG